MNEDAASALIEKWGLACDVSSSDRKCRLWYRNNPPAKILVEVTSKSLFRSKHLFFYSRELDVQWSDPGAIIHAAKINDHRQILLEVEFGHDEEHIHFFVSLNPHGETTDKQLAEGDLGAMMIDAHGKIFRPLHPQD